MGKGKVREGEGSVRKYIKRQRMKGRKLNMKMSKYVTAAVLGRNPLPSDRDSVTLVVI